MMLTLFGFLSIYAGIQFGKLSYITSVDEPTALSLDVPEKTETGKFNVLLLGVDKDGTRADTIMLFSVDNISKSIKMLSVPRDTKITLSSGRDIKINACLGFKTREKFLIETLKAITKMPIHYYCEINFESFIEIVDILGGVDYDVPYDMNYDDPVQNLHIHLKAGMQHLDGQAAHDFVRFRHNNKGEGVYAPGEYAHGDIGRIGAQQNFLKELFRQKMQPQYLLKAADLLSAASDDVKTNFTLSSALDFVGILKSAETTEIESFVLPGEARYIGKVSYYVYSPSQTEELILTEFGFPEDKAAALAQQTQASPAEDLIPETEEENKPAAVIK